MVISKRARLSTLSLNRCALTYQVVLAHSRNRRRQRNVGGCKNLRTANTRPLENLGCSKSTRRQYDLSPSFDDPGRLFLIHVGLKICAWPKDHPNRLLAVVVKDDALHVCLNKDVKIGKPSTLELRMDVCMGGVLAFPIGADVSLSTHGAVDGVQGIVVWKLWPAYLLHGSDKVIFQFLATIVSWAN